MLFTEFGFDVNRNLCKYEKADCPLVHAVRRGDLALVRFMIEELGADIRVRSQQNKEDIRIIAIARAIGADPLWRDESIRVREYVINLFEREGLVSAYWNNNTMVRLTWGGAAGTSQDDA